MFNPPNSVNMKDISVPQIFLGIQGASGTGKTFAAATFPNPIFMDLDKGLTVFTGRDLVSIPFWDDKYCVETLKFSQDRTKGVVNKRDGIKKWLREVAINMEPNQTLVLDSWTSLQICFDRQTDLEPVYTKKGEIDEFAFWQRKIDFSQDIYEYLKALRCHVVVLFHELCQRDPNSGQLVDKIQPLMQGKFLASIQVPFSDFFRQHVFTRVNEKGVLQKVEGKEIVGEREWFWQIKSDATVNLKSRMNRPEKFIPATYESFNYKAQ